MNMGRQNIENKHYMNKNKIKLRKAVTEADSEIG